MSLSRSLARPMLSAAFVVEGINTLRDPRPRVEASEDKATTVGVLADPELRVKVIAGVQVAAGLLLAVGKFRRLSAVALIGSTIPIAYSGQRFWEVDDPQERGQQLVHFSKNVGLIGGLILELVDTEGAPSLRWRARRAAKHAGSVISGGSHAGNAKTSELTERTGRQAAKAAAVALAGAQATLAASGHAVAATNDRSKTARKAAGKSAKHAVKHAKRVAATSSDLAVPLFSARSNWAGEALNARGRQAAHLLETGSERAADLLAVGANQIESAWHSADDRLPAH